MCAGKEPAKLQEPQAAGEGGGGEGGDQGEEGQEASGAGEGDSIVLILVYSLVTTTWF